MRPPAPTSPPRAASPAARHARAIAAAATAIALALPIPGCRDEPDGDPTVTVAVPESAVHDTSPGPPRDAQALELFFGDLHVHTGWSFDAFEHGVQGCPIRAPEAARHLLDIAVLE